MDRVGLLGLLEHSAVRIKNREQVEEAKLEVKREWPNLVSNELAARQIAESEFLKDLVGLANKPGPEGYLVYGLDGKTGEFFDAPFKQTGLKDVTELHGLVVKFVDLPVKFELIELQVLDKTLSVIVIPPSISKPHFITHYSTKKGHIIDNYIPIRKTTAVFPASRDDVEFMYYDRKNIEPDYALEIFTHDPAMAINGSQGRMTVDLQVVFENFGHRPIVIVESSMKIDASPDAGIPKDIVLRLRRYAESSIQTRERYLENRFLTIPSNQVATLMLKFEGLGPEGEVRQVRENKNMSFEIMAKDVHGNEYQSRKFIRRRP